MSEKISAILTTIFSIIPSLDTFLSILEVVLLLVPSLMAVAFITLAERKTMASMQRRLGPNNVGYYGMLQAFADALKLILKEYVAPTQANTILFFFGPIVTLIFALLSYAVMPYGPGLTVLDSDLGIFYLLAVSSLATYGILLAGWSANSKYAFLGSIRSSAQLIAYELVLSTAILLAALITCSFNLTQIIEIQRSIWLVIPLLPIFLIFFIGAVAETNRAPFDLAEAESELVSGFMTEHSAAIFVFFFLAEYASILIMCILTTIIFLGGYLPWFDLIYWFDLYHNAYAYVADIDWTSSPEFFKSREFAIKFAESGLFYGIIIGIKSSFLVFVFIWVRASFPRIRFDQLMWFCWNVLIPLLFGLLVFLLCTLYAWGYFYLNI